MYFPKLKSDKGMRKFDNYVLFYGPHPSEVKIIHPSQAFILSMCTGEFSRSDIEYIFSETYQMNRGDSNKIIDNIFSEIGSALETNDKQIASEFSYRPIDFIYACDDELYNAAKKGKLSVPAGININLSLNCNFKCHYCYQVVETGKNENENKKLDFEKCLSLIREAANLGMVHIGLTGGEPTLFPGWMELLEEIIKSGMHPTFTSNASVIGTDPLYAKKLRDIGLKEITISLDASYEDLHHAITNSSNSFLKVIDGIRFLVNENIRVIIKCVLTPINFHDLENFIDFCVALGVQQIGITAMEGGSIGSPANSLNTLSTEQLQTAKKIVNDKSKIYLDKCMIYPPRDNCSWGENDWYPCGGLTMGMSIFPSGEVSICDKTDGVEDLSIGNVFQQNLMEIWQGEKWDNLYHRTIDCDQIDPDCAKCSKLSICRTGCFVDSHNTFGNYFKKHPNCNGYYNENGLLVTTIN